MALSLKVNIVEKSVKKTLQFDPSTNIFDACKIIRDKCSEVPDLAQPKDYGLFLPGEAFGTGAWLEPGKTLDYYLLRSGDTVEYRRKMRTLKVRTLDGTNKTMLVDDSQNVANLMVVICTKMGITNHDEYSLVRDLPEEKDILNHSETGTLTLRRKKEEKERDAKMEQLRKKLKTDDEMNWVDHTKTLREQGIEEWEVLLLRRKYFFSDQNIDSHDPVQLNLLYVQARDAILDGTHPVTQDKACEFAGVQCQIQFGDHNTQKHRTGFLDLKDFLPNSYVKVKGIEKKVFAEHKKHMGLTELDAKALYTKTARSLDTYGVTFFLVKEKMQGKNKLVPRLLGVTKDSVLRLDERTKEILKTWPLTTVRRWAASPNTFNLDFGDYADQYYSVQTLDGEQIAQLIAGYIDIILKKKQAKDHLGIEGDEGSALFEESVSPIRATIVQRQPSALAKPIETASVAKPAVVQAGPEGSRAIHMGHMQGPHYSTIRGQLDMAHSPQPSVQQLQMTEVTSGSHKALYGGQEAVNKSRDILDERLVLPPIGNDPQSRKWKETTMDTKKQNVQSHIAAMSAATAHVVTLTSSTGADEVDSGAVGEAVEAISSGLPEVAKDVRMIAALMDDSGEKLIDATRKLCNAFSDLLTAAEPDTKEPRQNLLSAAGRVGDASRALLHTIGEGDETQDILLSLAKAVANAAAALVVQARNCAGTVDDPHQREEIISAAAQAALAASELVACAKVVAPTINNDKCRNELMSATRRVAEAVEIVLTTVGHSTKDKNLKGDLQTAAREVSESLNRLMDHIRPPVRASIHESSQEGAVDTILVATDKIITSDNSADMVRQARILAQATAQLIQAIKGEAERTPDSDQQRKLIAAAKLLAEATSRLVEAAKACASNPNAPSSQDLLKQAAQDLREATNMAAGGAVQRKNLRRLETAAKNAASAAAQTIAASQSASPHCNNATTREAMSSDCRAVADSIPNLVSAVKSSLHNGDDTAQNSLMEATDKFLKPSNSLVSTTKNASSFIDETSSARHLSQCSQKLAVELVELRTALERIKADSGLGYESNQPKKQMEDAADKIREIKEEIIVCRKAAARNELRPLPGDTVQNSIQRLTTSVRKVGTCTNQLVHSVASTDAPASTSSAQGLSSGLSDLVTAARAVASTTDDPRVLLATEEALERSWTLLRESGGVLMSQENADEKEGQLNPLAKGVHNALDKVSASIPGQKEVDDAIMIISNASLVLDDVSSSSGRGIPGSRNYGQLQTELQHLASEVADSSNEVVNSAPNPAKLGNVSKHFSSKTTQLINTGSQLASLHEDIEVREEIVITLKHVSISTTNLLVQAKAASANPDAPGMRNQLTAAARAVGDTLNQLINACSSAAPGQKECDNAVRRIQALKPLLENPAEPINSSSYFDCQQIVVEKSKLLGDSMTGIANYAKEGSLDEFGGSVHSAADAICGLVESSAQAAYLLAAAEPTSVAGRPGLVDMHSINESTHNIKTACQTLSSSKVSHQVTLSAATTIAKHTSALCTACRVASERTNDPTTKRQFVQMAKEVANATAALVKEIKDTDQSGQRKESTKKATDALVKSMNALVNYASQPEFVPVPAKISVKGRATQEPIVSSGRSVIEGSCNMLQAAKSLAINPKDPPTWQQLAHHSKHVSDSIKKLVTALREKAPGQKECENAVQKLNESLRVLNQASLSAISQSLPQRKDNNLQGFVQNAENSLRMAEEHVEPLRHAGRTEAENLGHQVSSVVSVIDSLVANIIGASSNIIETKEQVNLLERTRTVLESSVQFICAAKESGGNPKATSLHPELDLSAQCFQEGLDDLKASLERISSGAGGQVASISESIAASMVKLDQQNFSAPAGSESYVDYQSRMVNSAKEIARLSQEMVSKSNTDPSLLPQLSSDINHHYTQLANDARGAVATTISQDIGVRIRCGVQELGRACIDLVRCGGAVQFSRGDSFAQRDLSDANRVVSEKVSDILAALQAGSRGTQACINAASTVSGIIGDLDTTIMFATAGTLHAEGEETFADHRENILKTAKALVEDTKTLVTGAASTQEQLASAAQNAVATIVQLAEAVKFGAASLGSNNPESQVMLINAVRDVAGALYDLIHATKSAAGKGPHDPSMLTLKESAKIMVTNVTSLLKTVKAVEDEHTRGTRALEATIEAIAQEIRAFDSPEAPRGRVVTPEELVRATKPVTMATAKAVAAGSSCRQDDVIVAANTGRKAISDLLTACKSAAYAVEGETRERLLIAARQVAINYRELLQFVLHAVLHPTGADVKAQLTQCSRGIAQAVTELVAVGQLMKVVHSQLAANPLLGHAIRSHTHTTREGSEYEDPDDLTAIAENELLGAANSIDAAAKKLEKLRPRRSIREADETLNFDEMILEAAKSIAAATSALVKAASAAQRELVDSGRVSRKATSDSDDGQWSEGLVSAAQMVAAATHSLVEAANSLVKGHATEEKLISAAKQVAASTAQLLVACKVKASPDSDATTRLQLAGNTVKRATDNLVRAAQDALTREEERQLVLNKKMVGGIAQEIDARTDVLKMERQLEEARSKLAALMKARYQGKIGGAAGYTDDSDVDIETHETSRLDSLLESSAERIQSATSSFNIMRQQQQNLYQQQASQQSYNAYPTTSTPVKPSISPKPGTASLDRDRDRKFNNSSPYSTISNDSVGYQTPSQYQQPTPPPPLRNFQQQPPPPPPPHSSFRSQNNSNSTTNNSYSQGEDLYARPRQPDQYYSASSAGSTPAPTPTPKKTFLKPSEFYSEAQQGKSPAGTQIQSQGFVPPKGGMQVLPTSFLGKSFGKVEDNTSHYQQELSHYDTGPIQTEQVFESRGADGSVSLKRIFTQQQSSSTASRVTSSRKVFQHHEESN